VSANSWQQGVLEDRQWRFCSIENAYCGVWCDGLSRSCMLQDPSKKAYAVAGQNKLCTDPLCTPPSYAMHLPRLRLSSSRPARCRCS
jgi:hypothetical protein